jgi:phosphoglycolate phosphatase
MRRADRRPGDGAEGRPSPLRGVVTDVDGTLTDAHRRLDPRALDAVRRLEARGVPVTIATGNVLPVALALWRFLGASGPIVAENGGIIFRPHGSGGSVERCADRSVALRAFRAVLAGGVPARRLFTDRWRESEVALEPTVSVASVRRAVRGIPVTVESTGYAIHLMQRGVGKLPSLVRALRPLGLAPSDCVILGDGDNDVAMLRASGFGVSFPSGSPRARAAARFVTRSDYSTGFEQGLKRSGILA